MNNKNLILKKQTLVNIADAVRAKTGSVELIAIEDLDNAVAAIPSGGSSCEEWNGAYEEIVNGFTLTLQGSYPYVFSYSFDGGNTYTNISSLPVTIENVSKIKFKAEAGDIHAFNVGTSDGAYDVTTAMKAGGPTETDEVELTANTTWYISKGPFSGGAD